MLSLFFPGTTKESDWLDGVVVALHLLKEHTSGTRCTGKKIVLISDLGAPCSSDKLDVIVRNVKKEGVEFSFLYVKAKSWFVLEVHVSFFFAVVPTRWMTTTKMTLLMMPRPTVARRTRARRRSLVPAPVPMTMHLTRSP